MSEEKDSEYLKSLKESGKPKKSILIFFLYVLAIGVILYFIIVPVIKEKFFPIEKEIVTKVENVMSLEPKYFASIVLEVVDSVEREYSDSLFLDYETVLKVNSDLLYKLELTGRSNGEDVVSFHLFAPLHYIEMYIDNYRDSMRILLDYRVIELDRLNEMNGSTVCQ